MNSKQKPAATEATKSTHTNLQKAARTLIKTLGEGTAAAMAAKLVVTYGKHAADLESARLGEAIVEAMGTKRYNEISVL